MLNGAGRLERLFTEIAGNGWLQWLRVIPGDLRPTSISRLLARVPQGIPAAKVTAFQPLGWEYARRRRRARSPSELTNAFLWCGREFCARVNAESWRSAGGVYAFNSAGLETLELARKRGLRAVLEQTIAPRKIEREILAREFETHPGWQLPIIDASEQEYYDREAAEWSAAQVIVCGSQFVADGIRAAGGPAKKCVVVPYGVDQPSGNEHGNGSRLSKVADRPLRVLCAGAVGLRKGAPYVFAAAQALRGRARFRWVGGIELLPEATSRMAEAVQLTGSVPFTDMAQHFEWADVFLLASLCEGSAGVIYEALAYGLPVVCTPNCGSVVRDGVDGFIVSARDGAAIAERLERLTADAEMRARMSASAVERAREFTVEEYGRRLMEVLPGD
jgi:glycosyltransferase involved in cell wall biosynthesis